MIQNKLKIAHINTLNYGGAAVVARRIHDSISELGVDSLLFTKYGSKATKNSYYLKDARFRKFVRSHFSRSPLFQLAKQIRDRRKRPTSSPEEGFEIFSFLKSAAVTSEFDILNDRDILHLHWIADFLSYSSFFNRFSGKKFVWTLHDMNPFTGGCHHSDGCIKFQADCAVCPQLIISDQHHASATLLEKEKALKKLRDDQLIIVSPSRWLMSKSQKSRVLGRFKHTIIPNPSFRYEQFIEPRENVRKQLNLPSEKKIILFASDNLNNPRKGLRILFEAIRLLANKKDLLIVGIGHKSHKIADINIHYTGNISNSSLLSRYFYSADLFVTPSLAENSPLVVIEALTCGTPVVASAVGGIPEIISEENGIVFPPRDVRALAEAIAAALVPGTFDRNNIMQSAVAKHSPLRVAKDYLDVYNSLTLG